MENNNDLSSGNEDKIYEYLSTITNCEDCLCAKSYIRFFHAVPNCIPIDIYINDVMVVYDLKFGQLTQFMMYMEGTYNLQIFNSGNVEDPLYVEDFKIDKNSVYTIVKGGDFGEFYMYYIKEKKYDGDVKNNAIVNFNNFLNVKKNLDMYALENDLLYQNVAFGKTTENKLISASEQRFSVSISGTEGKLADSKDIKLVSKTYYNIFCIGTIGKVEVVILPGGLNYLDVC